MLRSIAIVSCQRGLQLAAVVWAVMKARSAEVLLLFGVDGAIPPGAPGA